MRMNSDKFSILLKRCRTLLILIVVSGCFSAAQTDTQAVYMGNGIKIGEVDFSSAIVWARLTKRPERNIEGTPFPVRKNPWDKQNQIKGV